LGYLCAVIDWHTRYVHGWAVSNTMDAALTNGALENAVKNCQKLQEIFNTDQGSQFTSPEWVGKLEGLGMHLWWGRTFGVLQLRALIFDELPLLPAEAFLIWRLLSQEV
jgi:transposase InsO family protein